jgi:hypothetical protein
MERTKRLLATIEHLVATKSKRHIVGGILLSTSIFLGGLAVTVLSTRVEEKDEYDQIYLE